MIKNMSLRKQVRSKVYLDEVFDILGLGKRVRYGRLEFAELSEAINKRFVGGVSTQTAINEAIEALDEEDEDPIEGGDD